VRVDPFRDEVQVAAEVLTEWMLEPEFPPLVGRAEQSGESQRRMAEEAARGICGRSEKHGGLEGGNDLRGIATSPLGRLPDLRESGGISLGRVDPVRVPAIGEATGQLQHAWPVRAQADLRSAPRWSGEFEDTVGDLVKASCEADRARRVQAGTQDDERFLQPGDRSIEGETIGIQILCLPCPDPDDGWPPRQMCQGERCLREQHGMAANRIGDADTEPEAPGMRTQATEQAGEVVVAMGAPAQASDPGRSR
jgi:hypothetical protein